MLTALTAAPAHVAGGGDGSAPAKLRVFINRDDLDFSSVQDLLPVQEWDLVENTRGDIEYPVQV